MVSKISDYKKRRKEMIEYLGGQCCNCHCIDNLHIDHVDHTLKTFDVSSRWSIHWDVLTKELNKCQLLCKECHKEKTLKEGSLKKGWTKKPRQKHGTAWSYAKYKCRCNLCREAKSKARKKENQKLK